METLVHADIFFFLSSVALVLLSAGVLIALFFAIKILRNIWEISEKIRQEGGKIIEDVANARKSVKEEGVRLKHFFEVAARSFMSKTRKRSKAKKDGTPDISS